ncbi:hypothetical protein [Martelella mediterranea]|nr:hypothetical protein [Martelella mediterranea]
MQKLTIKELLTWAFTEELCKEGAGTSFGPPMIRSAWAAMAEVEALGTMVDRSPNSYGVIPGFVDAGEPHEDALKVADAVRALTREGFDIPEGWQPFPEWEDERGLIADEVERVLEQERARGERQTGRYAYNLIVACAVLKRGPDWWAERPTEHMVMRRGSPAWFVQKRMKDSFGQWHFYEADGFDRRARRPMKGAYRKYELAEPVRGAVLSRIDWMVWQAALQLLERELLGRTKEYHLVPMRFSFAPWKSAVRAKVSEQVIEIA